MVICIDLYFVKVWDNNLMLDDFLGQATVSPKECQVHKHTHMLYDMIHILCQVCHILNKVVCHIMTLHDNLLYIIVCLCMCELER